MRFNQIMEMMAGDRQDRLPIELGIIQTIQQMNASRAGGGHAHTQPPGIFRITAGHESGRLLMPHLQETQLVAMGAQRFHNAIDTISRKTEDNLHAPINESFNQNIRARFGHNSISPFISFCVLRLLPAGSGRPSRDSTPISTRLGSLASSREQTPGEQPSRG